MATKKIERLIEETKEIEKKEEKKYTIRLPKDNLNPQEKFLIVGVNELYAKIPLGETIEVTEPVYEVLKNSGLI